MVLDYIANSKYYVCMHAPENRYMCSWECRYVQTTDHHIVIKYRILSKEIICKSVCKHWPIFLPTPFLTSAETKYSSTFFSEEMIEAFFCFSGGFAPRLPDFWGATYQNVEKYKKSPTKGTK
jgi:hypothetical protein